MNNLCAEVAESRCFKTSHGQPRKDSGGFPISGLKIWVLVGRCQVRTHSGTALYLQLTLLDVLESSGESGTVVGDNIRVLINCDVCSSNHIDLNEYDRRRS